MTSLHYYFPWAISALVKWSTFCLATGRRPNSTCDTTEYFEIADDPSLDYDEKLDAYLPSPTSTSRPSNYHDWCAEHLPDFDDAGAEWVAGATTSTACSSRRSTRRTPRTSRSSSSRTSVA